MTDEILEALEMLTAIFFMVSSSMSFLYALSPLSDGGLAMVCSIYGLTFASMSALLWYDILYHGGGQD